MASTSTAEPRVAATALIADLRNFTPNLNASRLDGDGIDTFCGFLGTFYGDLIDACVVALPPALRATPPIALNSTGDGALVVFHGEDHALRGYLAAILMDAVFARRCNSYNHDPRFASAPGVTYGIGVESGHTTRTRAAASVALDAYIGHCVNIAARIEALTKVIDRAHTVFADSVVEQVSSVVLGRTFQQLRDRESVCTTDGQRVGIQDDMMRLNIDLCISYLGRHRLKGVESSMPVYRLSRMAVRLGVERFERLLRGLVRDDAAHLADVRAVLAD